MGAMTDKLETYLLNHMFRNIPYQSPVSVTIGLIADVSNVELVESGTITEITNVGRVTVSCSSGWSEPFASGTAMAVKNKAEIAFSGATSYQGLVNGVGIFNNNELIFYGALTNPRTINQGDQFVFPSGSLKVTFN
jgi:hypothetical protein